MQKSANTHTWKAWVNLLLENKYLPIVILLILTLAPTIQLWDVRFTDTQPRHWYKLIFCIAAACSTGYVFYRLKIKLFISCTTFWASLAFALLFNLTLNKEITQQPHQLANAVLLTQGIILLVYALFQRYCFIVWIPLIFILCVQYAALSMYGIDLNAGTLAQVFNANMSEVLVYLTGTNCVLIVLIVTVTSLCCYMMHRCMREDGRITLIFSTLICLSCLYAGRFFLQPLYYNQDCGLWPLKNLIFLVSKARDGVKENEEIRNQVYALPSPADAPSESTVLNGGEGVNIVLHIGESITSDHLSSHGYHRNTMPFVNELKNIVWFKDCTASSVYTLYAVTTILTDARRGYNFCKDTEMKPTVSSFTDLLVKHTFKQYCLFDEETLLFTTGQNTFPKILRRLTEKSVATYGSAGLPMEQIPLFRKVLSQGKNANKIVVINNEGSHSPFLSYNRECPAFGEKNAPLSPYSPSTNAQAAQLTIDHYDNTIHYTDQYIQNVIEEMKGTPYIYIYISDHGEYLGENNQWNRAMGDSADYFFASQGCRIPFFIIYSPELISLHPHFSERIEYMKKNAHLRTAHEHVFHTILGLAGIKSPHYKAELDLSSPHAQPYTGPHPLDHKK